jgi:hypothetical protein
MISPDEAWKTEGIPCWALAVPDIVELEEKKPPISILPGTFRLGFKAGVRIADRDFLEKLKPEHRQN